GTRAGARAAARRSEIGLAWRTSVSPWGVSMSFVSLPIGLIQRLWVVGQGAREICLDRVVDDRDVGHDRANAGLPHALVGAGAHSPREQDLAISDGGSHRTWRSCEAGSKP